MCQMMVDNATRLECAKCLELFIPTEFLEHVTSIDGCKGSIYKDNYEKSKAVSSENTSPIPAKDKKKVNNENNFDEINPMSERCSYSSISIKSKKPLLDRKNTLPPNNPLKERSIPQFSNISGSEQQPHQMHQSMSSHQYNMFNHAGRNVMS